MTPTHVNPNRRRPTPANTSMPATENAGQILPQEKTQAMQRLIKLTRDLIDLGERESQALAQNDMLSFAIIQDEKALMAEQYAAASTEFRTRLPEFRGMNDALVKRLSDFQHELGDITSQNNRTVEGIYERTKDRTQKTLEEANEISQEKRVAFDDVFANENKDKDGTGLAGHN